MKQLQIEMMKIAKKYYKKVKDKSEMTEQIKKI